MTEEEKKQQIDEDHLAYKQIHAEVRAFMNQRISHNFARDSLRPHLERVHEATGALLVRIGKKTTARKPLENPF